MKNPLLVIRVRQLMAIACAASLTPLLVNAQQVDPKGKPAEQKTPASTPPVEKAPEKKPVEPVRSGIEEKVDDTIVLSPFEVTATNNGYMATNTASGTRLNSSLADIASPISVVTKQQLLDMSAVDINDIFRSEANVEGLYQYTEFGNDRGAIVDTASNNPESANRIRGMGTANLSISGMASSAAIPIDTYNVDSVEISRGANSNIFGIGSTAGTVNLNVAQANFTKDFSKISVRADSYGGLRETVDFNRVLIRGKLGLRVLGAYDDVGYIREPSFDKTKRFTVAVRAQPFRTTTLKVSYETYRNTASRPNMLTPRETITQWQSRGGYTWDPTTWSLYDRNNNVVGTYLGTAAGGNQLLTDHRFLGGSNLDSNLLRPGIGYINGRAAYFSTNQNGVNGNQRLVYYTAPQVTTRVADKINPTTGQPYGVLESYIDNLVSINGEAGKALYDWEEYNVNAANFSKKESDMVRFEVEHNFLNTGRHLLAAQVAGFYESIESNSYNFIGNGGDGVQAIVQVDVNRTLPDGSPNPGYLRPFLGGSQPQRYRKPENNFTNKAQLAYVLDFTGDKGWSKWLGKHNFLGYGEYRERQFSPNALRYRSQITNAVSTTDNTAFLVTRYYLGDASGYNIDSPTTTPPMTGQFAYTTFAGTPAAFSTQTANINQLYFSQGLEKHEIRSKGAVWQGFLLDGKVIPTIGYREDGIRFFNNKGFPTYTIDNTINVGNPDGGLFNFQNAAIVTDPKTGRNVNRGITRTFGVVLKPLKWLNLTYNQSDSFEPVGFALDTMTAITPNPTGESRDYGIRFNLLNEKLWISFNRYEASQKDVRYGFANVLAGRAFRYDFDVGADPDSGFAADTNNLDMFDWLYRLTWGGAAINPTTGFATVADRSATNPTGTQYVDPVWMTNNGLTAFDSTTGTVRPNAFLLAQYIYTGAGDSTHSMMGFTTDYIRKINGNTITATQDMESEGYELEVNYSGRHWSAKLTGAKTEARDTKLSSGLLDYLAFRRPIWESATFRNETPDSNILKTTVAVPGGYIPTFGTSNAFWTSTFTGSGVATRESNYYGVVENPLNITIANVGKTRPQLRRYKLAFTGRYELAGISDNAIIKNIKTGAYVAWSSKAVIGYGYADPILDRSRGVYVVRLSDTNKPYYDKARATMDWWASYDFRLFSNRIKSSVQLNVQNVFEDGRLQAVQVNSDGTPWAYRIVDPRKILLTLNLEL